MTPTTKRHLALLCGAALLVAAAGCGLDEEPTENVHSSQISKATCAKLQSCDANTPCKNSKLDCIYLKSCGKAACIDPGVACKLECGANATCVLMESYPAQIGCQPKPTTPSCSKLQSCGVYTPCKNSKLDCIFLKSCNKAACVDSGVACTMECGANATCYLMESYPGQIGCGGAGGSTPGGSTPSSPPGSTPGGSGGATP